MSSVASIPSVAAFIAILPPFISTPPYEEMPFDFASIVMLPEFMTTEPTTASSGTVSS